MQRSLRELFKGFVVVIVIVVVDNDWSSRCKTILIEGSNDIRNR